MSSACSVGRCVYPVRPHPGAAFIIGCSSAIQHARSSSPHSLTHLFQATNQPMAAQDKGDIVVCGAGLVGSLVGYVLQKRGYSVTLYER
jgi:NADPH-dependent 2,4-dienoyl-CoA reductase/sulfur reductase-like enzyme